MKAAVISDIHSNHPALEACVRKALEQGAEAFLFLGDYVSDCACPRKTLEILYGLKKRYDCRFIRGNREEYMMGCRASGGAGWRDGSTNGALLYTYENLIKADLDWFESLDIRAEVEWPGAPPLFLCHGSPERSNGRFAPEEAETGRMLREISAPMVLCGHTHLRAVYIVEGKRVVNPGSCGLPLGTPGRTQFALLRLEADVENAVLWKEELLEVSYDAAAAVLELEESGLTRRAPVWTAMTREVLLTGVGHFDRVLMRARELYERETGTGRFSQIPEKYWEQAAAEAGVGESRSPG